MQKIRGSAPPEIFLYMNARDLDIAIVLMQERLVFASKFRKLNFAKLN